MPIVLKYSGDATRTSIAGCNAGDTGGRPAIANEMLKFMPLSGRPITAPVDRTPGSARRRGSSASKNAIRFAILLVARVGQRQLERQRLLRPEARIDRLQPGEAAHQQTGAGEQHHRERHFDDDERAAHAGAGRGS